MEGNQRFCGLGLKPGDDPPTPPNRKSSSPSSAPRIADISIQISAKTSGPVRLPRRGSSAKKVVGLSTTRRTTSAKLFTGSERLKSPPPDLVLTLILTPLSSQFTKCLSQRTIY